MQTHARLRPAWPAAHTVGMRTIPALLLALPLLLLSTTTGATTPADSTWTQHLAAARAALNRGDSEAARVYLARVDSLVHGHAGAQWALAGLEARAGRRDLALGWLRAAAATGLARPFASDSAFTRWREEPDFREVGALFAANARPVAQAQVAIVLPDTAMLAEDLLSRGAGSFLVSSIHRGTILAVGRDGHAQNWFAGASDTWGIYALGRDAARGLVWASTAAGPECARWTAADSGRTAVFALTEDGARIVRRVELPRAAARQILGDFTVAPDGTVYACESLGGAVYRLAPSAAAFETLVAPGAFRSPQGAALAADGARLYVADYARGIAEVRLADGAVRWLPKPYTLASGGIDGLHRVGRRLYAVQNGTEPRRVLELTLDASGGAITAWRTLESGSPRLGEPNHAVVAGGALWFLGDSGWDRVDDAGVLRSPPGSRPPVVLRLPLRER